MTSRDCGGEEGMIFSGVPLMIDNPRQLPTPSAMAWRIDLAGVGAPMFVVMRTTEAEAREALATHLVAIGSPLANTTAAERAVNAAPADSVAVVW